jgi:site-specific recombinase XerD
MRLRRRRNDRPRLEDTVRAFEGYLARVGRTQSTCAKYLEALEPFALWLGDRSPGALSSAEIDGYLKWWYDAFEERWGKPPAAATYRAQITALKAFFAYLDRSELLLDNTGKPANNRMALVEAPKRETKPIDWLKETEDQALLAHVGTPNVSQKGYNTSDRGRAKLEPAERCI